MSTRDMDLVGLECPEPTMKIGVAAAEMDDGDMIVATADCEMFPDDVTDWCDQTGATLVSLVETEPGVHEAEIQL